MKTHNKIAVFLLIISILSFFIPQTSYAAEVEEGEKEDQETLYESAQKAVDQEEGNVFERILARLIVSIAIGLRNFGYNILDFNSLDQLIFNKGDTNPDSMFDKDWDNTMDLWFKGMRILTFPLLLIAVIITGLRFIHASTNIRARGEAVASIQRLFFSVFIILAVPIFIDTLIKLNNYLVSGIRTLIGNGSLDKSLGMSGNLIGEIKTGSALLTALVILLFIGIEFRLNIMFFMRMFIVTVLYIFTPFVATMWAIEKSINAAGIWIGEMISNIFMQFAYAFVFMVFLAFAPYMGTGGTIITVMILISVAEIIRNSTQALWIRLSGLDEGRTSTNILATLGIVGEISSLGKTISAQFGSFTATKKIVSNLISKNSGSSDNTTQSTFAPATAGTNSSNLNMSSQNIPARGGSINNAHTNAITGLGILQTVSNAAQMTTESISTVALLPFGKTGQNIASNVGNMTGKAVRTIGTPVAMAGSAIATSLKRGEGLKGVPKAYKQSLGVSEQGAKSNIKTAWRTISIAGRNIYGGVKSSADIMQQYNKLDPLDKIRY